MNILPIAFNNIAFTQKKEMLNNSPVIQPKYMYTLDRDTVNFTAAKLNKNAKAAKEVNKNKVKNEESKEVSIQLCSDIHEEAKRPANDLLCLLRREFKGLVASEAHPENPIRPGANGIKVRVKSPRSIREKALSTDNRTKDSIKGMGDVVGARIVMQSSTQEDFDKVFQILGSMVEKGKLKVTEVENYRLTSKDSYVSQKTLDKFEERCTKCGQYPEIKSKPIPNGYTAIHITLQLENGLKAELQIMGHDTEHVKEIEDFYYKLRCKKDFDPKYKSIEKIMKEKMKNLSEFEQEALNKYIKDSYIHARELPPRNSKPTVKDFLPWPYFLPKELSYVELYRMKTICDKKDKATKEAKAEKEAEVAKAKKK